MSLDLLKPCQLNNVISRVETLPSLSKQSMGILHAVAEYFQDPAFFASTPLTTQQALQKGMDLKKSYDALKTLEKSLLDAKEHAPRDLRIAYLKTAFQVSCLVCCGITAAILGVSTMGSVALVSFWVVAYLVTACRFLKQSGDFSHGFCYAILTGKNLTLPIKSVFERIAFLEESVEPQKQALLKILTEYQEKFSESLFQDANFYQRRGPLLLQRSQGVTVQIPEQLKSFQKAQQELRALISFYQKLQAECPAFA